MKLGPFRKKRNKIVAQLSELGAPALRTATKVLLGKPTKPSEWRRGLLIGCSHIGDILFRTGSLSALSRGLPHCTWDVVCERGSADVLVGNPSIRRVIPADGGGVSAGLSKMRWDVAICYDSRSYVRHLLQACQLKIPNRVGYVHRGFSGLVTHPISIRQPQPISAYFRDLVGELLGGATGCSLRPEVSVGEPQRQAAITLWNRLGLREAQPVAAIFSTTRQEAGAWPTVRFAEVTKIIERSRSDVQTVLLGGPGEAALLENLCRTHGLRAKVSAGGLGLREMVAFLDFCQVVLTPDSGPRHLAAAAGARVVFARNVSVDPVETGVYLESEVDFLPPTRRPLNSAEQEALFDRVVPERVAALVLGQLDDCWTARGAGGGSVGPFR